MDFRNAGGMGRDMDLRFQSRDQNFRSSNQVRHKEDVCLGLCKFSASELSYFLSGIR